MPLSRRRSARSQHGFTMIEVLVAILILAVGILATLGSLISAGKLTLSSQVHEAAIGFAEQQIELLRQQPFASLGMTSPLPTPSLNVNDPNFYVSPAGSSPACYQVYVDYQNAAGLIRCESFVTGGTVPSTPQTITGYTGLSGTYDIYVTSHLESATDNGCVTILALAYCLTGAEKRITVAVLPSSQSGTGARKPVWVTSIITDPNTPPLSLP